MLCELVWHLYGRACAWSVIGAYWLRGRSRATEHCNSYHNNGPDSNAHINLHDSANNHPYANLCDHPRGHCDTCNFRRNTRRSFLTYNQPLTNLPKESVLHTNTVSISGNTAPDALLSINGVLIDVDGNGRFTSTLTLQEGPNVIEILASNFQGNKVSAVLTIISIP